MTDTSIADTHPIIPLALLESLRRLDLPARDGLEEFHKELAVKRLGMSQTVAQQIERFQRLASRGTRVDAVEVEALLRLVGRRVDADLVFTDAGRLAGGLAVDRTAWSARQLLRRLPPGLRNGGGVALGRGTTGDVFGMELARVDGLAEAELAETLNTQATPSGASCAFFGSAVAEILRQLTDFDGAMLHVECRAQGGATCRWRAAANAEDS
ncbi:MAG TPA: hypothetical protein VGI83_01075 [Gemmatimonadales bacterium]